MADRAKNLGFTLTGEQLQIVFEQFKVLADKKKEIYDGDIIALVQQQISGSVDEEWTLVDYVVTSGKSRDPYVELTLRCGDTEATECIELGDGPIDAAFWAVEKITGIEVVCKDFLECYFGRDHGEGTRGYGRTYAELYSTDSVESTILAMLNAINRSFKSHQRRMISPLRHRSGSIRRLTAGLTFMASNTGWELEISWLIPRLLIHLPQSGLKEISTHQ